ncbi:olfactory receptor 10A7-like [Pelodytes ibericus]
MSYDRYLAICNPLHYASIMNHMLCLHLVIWSWLLACIAMLFLICLICNLQFCGPRVIDHYFCDMDPILKLSCSDHAIIDHAYFLSAMLFTLIPFSFILFTYAYIFITISRISSTIGKQKAFSTCSSHLIVVSTYYGTIISVYLAPSKGQLINVNKFLSLLYTTGTPLFNQIIYSLRNHDIKIAILKCISRHLRRH